jgi:hypothetical protein
MKTQTTTKFYVYEYDYVKQQPCGFIGCFMDHDAAFAAAELTAEQWCQDEEIAISMIIAPYLGEITLFQTGSDFGTIITNKGVGVCKVCGKVTDQADLDAWFGACLECSKYLCSKCGSVEAEQRYSLGLYAGKYCEPCWDKSGYRKEGKEGFDPMDAGESYEPI